MAGVVQHAYGAAAFVASLASMVLLAIASARDAKVLFEGMALEDYAMIGSGSTFGAFIVMVASHYFILLLVLLIDAEVLYRLVHYVVLANMLLLLLLLLL